jgi:hypothetical protein
MNILYSHFFLLEFLALEADEGDDDKKDNQKLNSA